MKHLGDFKGHRRGTVLGAALVLPLPFFLASSNAPLTPVASSTSSMSVAAAAADPDSADGPAEGPLLGDLGGPGPESTEDGQLADPSKTVITSTLKERVLDVSANTSYDVPLAALQAYKNAARQMTLTDPGCKLSWGVLAAIGQVESGHGRYGGAAVLANGKTAPAIVGLPLDGAGPVAEIADTDDGRYDGDKIWDRAVGPMQFIPTTWASSGADGDADGLEDPNDFDDATLAAAQYLCSGAVDMTVPSQARSALLRYNNSQSYVDLVLRIANVFDSGIVDVVPNDPSPTYGGATPLGLNLAGAAGPGTGPTPAVGTTGGRGDSRPDGQSGLGDGSGREPSDGSGDGGAGDGRPGDGGRPTGGGGGGGDPQDLPDPGDPKPPPPDRPPPPDTDHPPEPEPEPDPEPDPEPVVLVGTLTTTEDGEWLLDGEPLQFGADPEVAFDFALFYGDFDADGVSESMTDELTQLLGTPETGAPEISVTLSPDGIVTHVQDVELLAVGEAPDPSQPPASETPADP